MQLRPRRTLSYLLGLLVLAIIATASPAIASDDVISLDFDEASKGTELQKPQVRGSSASEVSTRVIVEAGGRGTVAKSAASADGRSLAFPRYSVLRRPITPLAVLRVRNATDKDVLDGSSEFSWSADFRLYGELGNDSDDGDNLFQRGLWGQSAQWKLSVDSRKAQCLLGFGNRRISTPVVHIPDGRWHRATCRRRVLDGGQSQLSLYVQRWNGNRFASFAWVRSSKNAAGSLNFARNTPVSIGGKLRSQWALHSAPDQFNGRVDRVRLTVY